MVVYNAEPLEYPKGTTLPELLFELNVNNVPSDKPAIIDGISGATVYTHGSFRASVRRVANYIRTEINLPGGAVVGILAANSNDYPVLVHGILAAGGVVSAFNPLYQHQEISHCLNVAKPRILLVDERWTVTLTKGLLLAKLEYTPDLYLIASDTTGRDRWNLFDLGKIITIGTEGLDNFDTQPDKSKSKVAFLCFSSGTTGPMKGVYLTHDNIVSNIFQHRQRLPEMFESHRTVAALITPFFHILGLGVFVCQYICQGIPIVVFPRFNVESLLDAIPRHRITHINIVPPIALTLLQATTASTADFSSLLGLINAAAPLKEVVSSELSRRLGCSITQWYGMTEASPSVISQSGHEVGIAGTVGRLLPGMSMRIVDPEGKECHPSEAGELLIQGPNLMPGYVGISREGSESPFADGYFKTGDIGYIDAKGYVFLVGRSKELIKVKGQQVAPAELESILLTHPKVRDAAVKGLYFSEQETEYPAAYIVVDPAASEHGHLEADVAMFVNKQVAKYKWLQGGVHVIPAIPRNASGKILRRQLPEPGKRQRESNL